MLYHLLYPLHTKISVFNVFKYITFRTIYATITALIIAFLVGPKLIALLNSHKVSQAIRNDGPPTHFKKEGTPTMGGILIIISTVIPTLLWANLRNGYIWSVIFILLSFGTLGFIDDYKKFIGRNPEGIWPRYKLLWQLIFATIFTIYIYSRPDFKSELTLPFLKNFRPDLGAFYPILMIIVIVGASNAVNLTDGLDGLAIGPVMITAGTYMLFCYLSGHIKIAQYLQIPYVPGAGELSIFCGALLGAGLGFLWFNAYPAQVFMGDVGSLSLGAVLGALAIISKQEILLVIVGGVFVIEALSVIFQVFSYKMWRKRIFKMAPIHHHFELKGWAEPKIIVRFWIISVILALIAISTLKLR